MTRQNLTDEALKALDEELKACNVPENEVARKFLYALSKGQKPKGKTLGKTLLEIPLVMIGEGLRQAIRKQKVRNEEELGRFLERLKGLRYKLRPKITEALNKYKDIMPMKTRGPKPRLTDTEKAAACNTIETLKHNGSTYRFAIELVAKDFKVTPRLMRKVWQQKGH